MATLEARKDATIKRIAQLKADAVRVAGKLASAESDLAAVNQAIADAARA